MRKTPWFLFAAIACAAPACAIPPGFEYVDQTEYADMLRDASLAYDRKDYDKAFKLFQRGACAGDKESQSALGRMYMLGQGAERDDLWGYAWLKVAAQVTLRGHRELLEKLDAAMRPEQAKIANARAANLLERYGMRAAATSCAPFVPKGSHIAQGERCTPQHSSGVRFEVRICENPVAPP